MEARSIRRTRGPGGLSAHPSAATRHRACHDLGPVTPIRWVPRDLVKAGDFGGIAALTTEGVALVLTLATVARWATAPTAPNLRTTCRCLTFADLGIRPRVAVPLPRGVPG